MKQVARYRERGKIDAAVTIARRLDGIAARADEFDTHPHLLDCAQRRRRPPHRRAPAARPGTPHPPTRRRRLPARRHPQRHRQPSSATIDARRAPMGATRCSAPPPSAPSSTTSSPCSTAAAPTARRHSCSRPQPRTRRLRHPASTRLLIARPPTTNTPRSSPTCSADGSSTSRRPPKAARSRWNSSKRCRGGTPIKARYIAKDQFAFTPDPPVRHRHQPPSGRQRLGLRRLAPAPTRPIPIHLPQSARSPPRRPSRRPRTTRPTHR